MLVPYCITLQGESKTLQSCNCKQPFDAMDVVILVKKNCSAPCEWLRPMATQTERAMTCHDSIGNLDMQCLQKCGAIGKCFCHCKLYFACHQMTWAATHCYANFISHKIHLSIVIWLATSHNVGHLICQQVSSMGPLSTNAMRCFWPVFGLRHSPRILRNNWNDQTPIPARKLQIFSTKCLRFLLPQNVVIPMWLQSSELLLEMSQSGARSCITMQDLLNLPVVFEWIWSWFDQIPSMNCLRLVQWLELAMIGQECSQRHRKHTREYEACGKLHGSDRSVMYELRTICSANSGSLCKLGRPENCQNTFGNSASTHAKRSPAPI